MQSKSSSSVRVFYARYDRKTLVEILRQKVEVLRNELHIKMLVLFGSYAHDTYTVSSDIDILLVCEHAAEDAYSKAKRIIGIPGIESHIYSEYEYRVMHETIKRMLEGSVTIYVEKGFSV